MDFRIKFFVVSVFFVFVISLRKGDRFFYQKIILGFYYLFHHELAIALERLAGW